MSRTGHFRNCCPVQTTEGHWLSTIVTGSYAAGSGRPPDELRSSHDRKIWFTEKDLVCIIILGGQVYEYTASAINISGPVHDRIGRALLRYRVPGPIEPVVYQHFQ